MASSMVCAEAPPNAAATAKTPAVASKRPISVLPYIYSPDSVRRHRRIDALRPGINASLQIGGVGKALLEIKSRQYRCAGVEVDTARKGPAHARDQRRPPRFARRRNDADEPATFGQLLKHVRRHAFRRPAEHDHVIRRHLRMTIGE